MSNDPDAPIEEDVRCPICAGFGCVDDDPEVRGALVTCDTDEARTSQFWQCFARTAPAA